MSKNKGKDGEASVTIALLGASIREDGVEVTRHTATNQPDAGEDCHLKGPGLALARICEVAKGKKLPELAAALGADKQEARIDVKTTSGKLTSAVVEKFISDIRKHPTTKLHILAGGSGLTKSASEAFHSAQDAYGEDGKQMIHLPIEDIERLGNEYKPEINIPFSGHVND